MWKYALTHGFTIISKDSDFHQLSFLHGHPPKVVWIRRGNCSTDEIALMLAGFSAQLIDFESDTTASIWLFHRCSEEVIRYTWILRRCRMWDTKTSRWNTSREPPHGKEHANA